jgi:hypothetical protein
LPVDMAVPRLLVAAPAVALMLAGCTSPEVAGVDREVQTLAEAISWPRQQSAAGFARAALQTPLGMSQGFAVLEAQDLSAPTLTDPMAHLTIRIYAPATGGWGEDVTACYSMAFNYYGIVGVPERIRCPTDATPIIPPPQSSGPDQRADNGP